MKHKGTKHCKVNPYLFVPLLAFIYFFTGTGIFSVSVFAELIRKGLDTSSKIYRPK